MSRAERIVLFCIPVVTIALIVAYINYTYQFLPGRVLSLKIKFEQPIQREDFVVYISDSTEAAPNLERPFFPQSIDNTTLLVGFGQGIKLRQFRLYFQRQLEAGTVREISLIGNNTESKMALNLMTSDQIEIQSSIEDDLLQYRVVSGNGYAYLETPPFYYPEDYWLLALSILVAVGVAYVFYFLIVNLMDEFRLTSISIAEWSVIAFILSIGLSQVLFNITLAISALLIIRNFKFNQFFASMLNLLYTVLFLLYVLNFLYFSTIQDFSYFEKYLSLIVLPIYAACINGKRLLIFFGASALLIGGTVLVGALVNLATFQNFEIITSDNLTGTIHPVYYSYLLAFSIIFVELGTNLRYKRLINFVLFALLVLSGSKLIIFCMLFLSLFIFRVSVKLVLIPLLLIVLFLFSPVRKNFGLIASLKDLTVLSELEIENPTDKRLNGLTLRLILWQENMRIERPSQLVFGNGIGPKGNALLEKNLEKRGLSNHLWYNAHNQYLTTFFHTGLVGLIALVSIVSFSIWVGHKARDRVLLYFSIITALAMMSESVFERVSGTTFFSFILLTLANSLSTERNEVLTKVDKVRD